jgi:hypothetical protein
MTIDSHAPRGMRRLGTKVRPAEEIVILNFAASWSSERFRLASNYRRNAPNLMPLPEGSG